MVSFSDIVAVSIFSEKMNFKTHIMTFTYHSFFNLQRTSQKIHGFTKKKTRRSKQIVGQKVGSLKNTEILECPDLNTVEKM